MYVTVKWVLLAELRVQRIKFRQRGERGYRAEQSVSTSRFPYETRGIKGSSLGYAGLCVPSCYQQPVAFYSISAWSLDDRNWGAMAQLSINSGSLATSSKLALLIGGN